MTLGTSWNVGKREMVSLGREKKSWRAGRVTLATMLALVESEGAGDGSRTAEVAPFRFFAGWEDVPGVDCREDSTAMLNGKVST